MSGSMKQVADAGDRGASAAKKYKLAGGTAFAQGLSHRIELSPTAAQVVVGDGEVSTFQHNVGEKKNLVRFIPEAVGRS